MQQLNKLILSFFLVFRVRLGLQCELHRLEYSSVSNILCHVYGQVVIKTTYCALDGYLLDSAACKLVMITHNKNHQLSLVVDLYPQLCLVYTSPHPHQSPLRVVSCILVAAGDDYNSSDKMVQSFFALYKISMKFSQCRMKP